MPRDTATPRSYRKPMDSAATAPMPRLAPGSVLLPHVGSGPGPPAPPPPSPHIPALDGLRGLAILLVMGFHFSGGPGEYPPAGTALITALRQGSYGVDLFFVL